MGVGDGDGYGYGDIQLSVDKGNAWICYHYIKRIGDGLLLRNGKTIRVGDALHEEDIAMCSRGLHASLCPADAKAYAPSSSVLTQVAVWGRIIVEKDKLVATDRQVLEIVDS